MHTEQELTKIALALSACLLRYGKIGQQYNNIDLDLIKVSISPMAISVQKIEARLAR